MFINLFILVCVVVYANSAPLEEEDEERGIDLSHLGDRVFASPSNETGKLLESWDPESEINPEELGTYAEGDIIFPQESRNGLIGQSFRWKNGVIPYEINGYFTSSDLNMIHKAMGIYHKYTCISFRPRTGEDTDYISLVSNPTGCWSSVGRIGGKQEINLQSPACLTKVGTPMHELMHAVGFLHEQNRYERDSYVSIAWQNIRKGHENNFDKADKDKTNGFGVPYDYRSVMHYSKGAFSTNGQPTIVATNPTFSDKMGQREGFSKGDLTKINNMYNCPEKTPGYNPNNKDVNNNVAPSNNNGGGGGLLSGLLSLFTGREEE